MFVKSHNHFASRAPRRSVTPSDCWANQSEASEQNSLICTEYDNEDPFTRVALVPRDVICEHHAKRHQCFSNPRSSLPVFVTLFLLAITTNILICPLDGAPYYYKYDNNVLSNIFGSMKQVNSFKDLPIVDPPVLHVKLYDNYTIGQEIVRIHPTLPSQTGAERSTSGAPMLDQQSNDQDYFLHYSLLNLNSYFSVDNKTGAVSIIHRIDTKQSNSYILDVKVSLLSAKSDYPNDIEPSIPFSKTPIIIDIIDINDNEPVPSKHVTRCFAYSNIESSVPICTIPVTDADSGTNGQMSFSISSDEESNDAQEFRIDSNTGTIYRKRSVKKLVEGDHPFVVSIVDHGIPYLETGARIAVTIAAPVNRSQNHAPIFVGTLEKQITVSENVQVGQPIGFFGTADPDGDQISMHITSGNAEGNYAIEEGNLILARKLLFNRYLATNLTLMATDGVDTIYHNITVIVPKLEREIANKISQHETILEVMSAVDEPVVANLTDDAVDMRYANFSLYSGSSMHALDAFTVDPSSGIVRLRKQLDYKMCKYCNLVIEIADTRFPRDFYRSFSKLNFQVLGLTTQPPPLTTQSITTPITVATTSTTITTIAPTTESTTTTTTAQTAKSDTKYSSSRDIETISPTTMSSTTSRITTPAPSNTPVTSIESDIPASSTARTLVTQPPKAFTELTQVHAPKHHDKNTIDRPTSYTWPPAPGDEMSRNDTPRSHGHRDHNHHSTTPFWPTRAPSTVSHNSRRPHPTPSVNAFTPPELDTRTIAPAISSTTPPGRDVDSHKRGHLALSLTGNSFIRYSTSSPGLTQLFLQFRTYQSRFVLMYSNNSHGHYILDAVGGNLRFQFGVYVHSSKDLVSGLIQLKSVAVNDGRWHALTIEKHGIIFSMTVDGTFTSSTAAPIPRLPSIINTLYHFYFGAEIVLVADVNEIYDTVRENGFVGCIDDIRIESTPLVVTNDGVSPPGLRLTNIEPGCNRVPVPTMSLIPGSMPPNWPQDLPPRPVPPGVKDPPIVDSYLYSALTQIISIVVLVGALLICCIFVIACSSLGKSKNKRRRKKNGGTLLRNNPSHMSNQTPNDTITRSINSRMSLRTPGHTHTPPIGRAHHSKYGAGDTVSLSAINEHKHHKPPIALPPVQSSIRGSIPNGGCEEDTYENFATVTGAFGPGHPEYLSELRKLKPDFSRSSVRAPPTPKKQSSASTVTSVITSSDNSKHARSPRHAKNSSCSNLNRQEARTAQAPVAHHAHSRSNISNRSVNTPVKDGNNSCNNSQRPLLLSDSKESRNGDPPMVRKRLRIKNTQHSDQNDVDYDEVDIESDVSDSGSDLPSESRFLTFTRKRKDKKTGDKNKGGETGTTTSDEDDDEDDEEDVVEQNGRPQMNGANHHSSDQDTDNGRADVLVDINGSRDNHDERFTQRKSTTQRQARDSQVESSHDETIRDNPTEDDNEDEDDDDDKSEDESSEGVYEINSVNGYHC